MVAWHERIHKNIPYIFTEEFACPTTIEQGYRVSCSSLLSLLHVAVEYICEKIILICHI